MLNSNCFFPLTQFFARYNWSRLLYTYLLVEITLQTEAQNFHLFPIHHFQCGDTLFVFHMPIMILNKKKEVNVEILREDKVCKRD